MEYKDFVEQVKEQIQDFLPEKFADAAVEVNQIVKNNDCVLDGLMVRTEESNISPTIYLNPYFEQIQDGAELDDILAQIASVYQSPYIDHDIDVSAVTDFDKIKEKIVCKLINEEANQQFLQDKPYSKLEDLAVVYQILMDKTGEGTATITITDNLMDGYGITLEEWNHDVDHVHVMFRAQPKSELSKFINAYKSASSRLLKKEYPQIRERLWKEAFWSQSFCLLTAGGAPIDVIRNYIETQGEKKR